MSLRVLNGRRPPLPSYFLSAPASAASDHPNPAFIVLRQPSRRP